MPEVVLVVDDDPVQRRLIENMVQRFGYRPVTAGGGDEAAALLTGPDARLIDCVILDMVMPDLDGLGVLARMREAGLAIPVIVQTAHGGIDNVVSAMRAGATDFVVKPASAERLQVSLGNALAGKALASELRRVKRSRDGTLTFADLITRSPRMRATIANAEKAAGSDIPVLIEGESGTGKEMIARAIHGAGARRAKPFVAVNCGALPEHLVESILFGHEKGAFTGATERHSGKFSEADGGTLFLDEIGELPMPAQVKLLRALQEGEVEPVGARRPIKVDVRIVSATNRDLIAAVKEGRFREDLFYRLHVFPVTVPPLRERPEDIPELARHFAARFAAEEGKRIATIGADALALLARYNWPGNVRQIENAVFRAVVLADRDTIGVNEFPHIAAQLGDDRGLPVMSATAATQSLTGLVPGDPVPVEPMPGLTIPTSTLKLTGADGHIRPLDEIEREVIRYAISHYRGQMSEVARRLKFGRSTLYRKLEGLGLREDGDHGVDSGNPRWVR